MQSFVIVVIGCILGSGPYFDMTTI